MGPLGTMGQRMGWRDKRGDKSDSVEGDSIGDQGLQTCIGEQLHGREASLREPSWRHQGHSHLGRMLPHWGSFWRIFCTQSILGSAQIFRPLPVSKLEGEDVRQTRRKH